MTGRVCHGSAIQLKAIPVKFKGFKVGPLPVEIINRCLGTDLEPGDVWVSSHAHRHIAEDHPADYPTIIAALYEIVSTPLYVGQDPKHGRNFYIVRPMPTSAANPYGLVSIGFEQNQHGGYNVRTAYSISQDSVTKRRAANRLHRVI